MHRGSAEVLTGRLAEYRELLEVLAARPGLTIISADPWSGTSALLAEAVKADDAPALIVDARACADHEDLAMAIADKAIERFAPDATAWWTGNAPPASAAGLRLARNLDELGVPTAQAETGGGRTVRDLAAAFEIAHLVAGAPALLIIDHFGLMLSGLAVPDRRVLLGDLRAALQRPAGSAAVLVEHTGGPVAAALGERDHPMHRAGQVLRITRPTPARFAEDLAVTRQWTDVPADLLTAAADLAAGVPALTWRIVELAPSEGDYPQSRALAGWRRLRSITDLSLAREWDLLRRVHPLAQTVVAAFAFGWRPHSIPANSKSIGDALARLRQLGLAWQPEERRWALSDPLLASWVRDNAPPWAARRRL